MLDESKGPGQPGYLVVDGTDRSGEAFRTVAMPVNAPAYRGAHAGAKPAVAWLGGERVYGARVLRDGELFQMTQDHTMDELLKAEAEQAGQQADPAETSRLSHVLYRVLDGREDREPDLRLREARLGDRYLLCSDGLSGPVDAQAIYEVVSAEADPQRAVDRLIELARDNGGPDNITAVIADVVEAEHLPAPGGPLVVGAAAQS